MPDYTKAVKTYGEDILAIVAPMEAAMLAYLPTRVGCVKLDDVQGYHETRDVIQTGIVEKQQSLPEGEHRAFKFAVEVMHSDVNFAVHHFGETKRQRVNGKSVVVPVAPTDQTLDQLMARAEALRVARNGFLK